LTEGSAEELLQVPPRRVYPRSVSSLKMYRLCGRQWEEVRFNKVPRQPAAWLPQGTGFHVGYEAWERSDRTLDKADWSLAYYTSFDEELAKYDLEYPDRNKWLTVGRTKIENDIANRRERGIEQLDRYIARCIEESDKWKVWRLPDDSPALEVSFAVYLTPTILVVGYIDVLVEWPNGMISVRDLKTGKREETALQLGMYAVAAKRLFEEEVTFGDFYYAKDDTYSPLIHLVNLDEDYFIREFEMMEKGIDGRIFLTNPGDHCALCPAQDICPEFGSAR
jgi:putative RecB family exonuclease